jgi:hypothetical protein
MGWQAICDCGWRSRSHTWRSSRGYAWRHRIGHRRNPGGTAEAGRGATGAPKPRGISGAGRQGIMVEVPAVVSQVPMVETVEPDSKKI